MLNIVIQSKFLLRLSLTLSLLVSCNPSKEQQPAQNPSNSTAIETEIDSILKDLTLEEKIGLVHAQSKFSTKGVERLGIPELWMSDGPHGVRAEISWDDWSYAGWTNDSITAFPALTCLAATFNPGLAKDYGLSLGEEARYRKKDVLLGPGVNIYRTPLNGRNFEYMGEDPFLASQLVVPYIEGVQENGVAACVKHYALNNQEKNRDKVNVEVSDRALHEIYLPAFKASVLKGNTWAIMGAYNKFRGEYTTHHELLMNDILKGKWNFDGVVISDWSSTHDTKKAALFGLDIEMGTGTDGLGTSTRNYYDSYYLAQPFLKAIQEGEIEESILDDKVRRVLRLRYRTNMNNTRPLGKANTVEHHQVARNVATEGIVLLKNEDNFFPIQDKEELSIAVIGENATRSMTKGGGSSELKAKFEISPLEGLKARYKNAKILHALGYHSGPSVYDQVIPSKFDADSLKNEALQIAKKADIVLFFGGLNKSHLQDCEGDDRQEYELPYGQNELIQELLSLNPNLAFVGLTGNAFRMPWKKEVKGILQSWYLGSMAGHAIADVISGDVNPSGKLPFTFPKELKDNPAHYFGPESYPGKNLTATYQEDILVGYRWHDTKAIQPEYAFGYGLSYTDFEVKSIDINTSSLTEKGEFTISCELTNTGNYDGAEVVQVYVGKAESKVDRALKELKGFEKLNILKGQSETASITVKAKDLAYYDESLQDWNVEKGTYTVYIGNSSDNIWKTFEITVD
jgi:beta-glucosidase